MAEVQEIADGIFRIATFIPEANITFNQFLIADEKPLLFHTGQRLLFPLTLEAVRQVIDPSRLRYISWSHLEADESGALNEFLQIAPQAEAVHSELGVVVNVNDFAIRPAKTIGDGEVLDLGRHKLRFLITPQVPHCWDAILAFEETTGTLMASDLFTQLGEKTSMTSGDMRDFMCHHGSQLGFVIGGENETAVDVEEATGQGKRVDLVRLDDFDRERDLGVRVSDNVLSDPVDVLVDHRIIDQLHLTLDFRSELTAHCDFLLKRDEVDAALVDVPIPDVIHIGVLLLAFGFGFVLD